MFSDSHGLELAGQAVSVTACLAAWSDISEIFGRMRDRAKINSASALTESLNGTILDEMEENNVGSVLLQLPSRIQCF